MFEPNETTYDILYLNMVANGLSEISTVRKEAVSLKIGKKKFYAIENQSGRSSLSKQYTNGRPIRFKRSTVRTVTLDTAVGNLTPKLIKIDVEGFERDVIMGGQNIICNNPEATVIVEWVPSDIINALGEKAMDDVLDFFKDYRCYSARYMTPLERVDHSDHQRVKILGGDLCFTKTSKLEPLVGSPLEDEELLG